VRALAEERGRVREDRVDVVRVLDIVGLLFVEGVLDAVGIRRTGVAAPVLADDKRSVGVVLVPDARDIRLGFAVMPSRFDSSPEVSTDVVEGRDLCSVLERVLVLVLVGLLTVELVVGLAGGLFREL
jgi:hypothetical protein